MELDVKFDEEFKKPGVIKMWSAGVYDSIAQYECWYAFNDFNQRTKRIYDHRDNPNGYEQRPMTASDLSLCEFVEPRFGDFDDLRRRVETYLQNEGFGTLRNLDANATGTIHLNVETHVRNTRPRL
jgi:hypothetical protein